MPLPLRDGLDGCSPSGRLACRNSLSGPVFATWPDGQSRNSWNQPKTP
jgi:hypothetical protein